MAGADDRGTPAVTTRVDPQRAARVLLAGTACTITVTLPIFLLGSHAAMIRQDLVFDEARLGLVVACFFGLSAVTSIPAGKLSQRFGARRVMLAGVALTALSLGGVSVLATGWLQLAAGYVGAGVANGLAQPATNHLLAEGLRPGRRGLGLSIKQTAPMVSSILAGLAVPLIGVPLGWRVGFALAAVVPALLMLATRPPTTAPQGSRDQRDRHGGARRGSVARDAPLVLFAVAGLFSAGAAGTLGSFLVESSVAQGIAAGPAGLLLSAGGAASLAARLGSGWLVDRTRADPLLVVPSMMLVGSTGMVLLAFGGGYGVLLVATLVAFGPGWGWPALLMLGTLSNYERTPAEAAGVLMAGVFTGGFLGPIVFGALVTTSSFTAAWLASAGQLLVAAGLILAIRRTLARRRAIDPDPVAS